MANAFEELWRAQESLEALEVAPDYDDETQAYLYAIGRTEYRTPPATKLPGWAEANDRVVAARAVVNAMTDEQRATEYDAASRDWRSAATA